MWDILYVIMSKVIVVEMEWNGMYCFFYVLIYLVKLIYEKDGLGKLVLFFLYFKYMSILYKG